MASDESVRRWDIQVDVTGDADIRPHITEAVNVLVGRLVTARQDRRVEVAALDTLTERAGLVWTCAADRCTGYRNQSNADRCGRCGAPRPEPPHQAGDKP